MITLHWAVTYDFMATCETIFSVETRIHIYTGVRLMASIALCQNQVNKEVVSDSSSQINSQVLLIVEICPIPDTVLKDFNCFKFGLFLTLQAFNANSTPLMVYHRICSEASIL